MDSDGGGGGGGGAVEEFCMLFASCAPVVVSSDGSAPVASRDEAAAAAADASALSPVAEGVGVLAFGSGRSHCVFATSSGVWAWGDGARGQLGSGARAAAAATRARPVRVPLPPWTQRAPVRMVSTGDAHTLLLLGDGALLTFGANEAGQCGAGPPSPEPQPARCIKSGSLRGAPPLVAVAAGAAHSVAVDAEGCVHVVGCNDARQLGEATTVDQPTAPRSAFHRLTAFGAGATGGAATCVAASAHHTLVVVGAAGAVWQLGHFAEAPLRLIFDVERGPASSPERGGAETGWKRVTGERGRIVSAAAGVHHSLALDDAGRVWSWSAPTLIWGATSARDVEPLLGMSGCRRC